MLTALFEPGSVILMLTHNHGGHMSHGDTGSLINRIYKVVEYQLNENGLLDYDLIEKIIIKEAPKMIFVGYSLYPRDIDYKRIS